jgi:2-oxoglutarate ferredoxin oxidoreductase subunit beta
MTGGQMGMTTLPGQITTTSPKGRDANAYPIDIMKHMSAIDHVGYAARGTTASVKEIRKLKKYMAQAIDMQMKHKKFAIVEILSQCPTTWRMTPEQSVKHVLDVLTRTFPLGEFKKMEEEL